MMYFKGTKLALGVIKCPQKTKGRIVTQNLLNKDLQDTSTGKYMQTYCNPDHLILNWPLFPISRDNKTT